MSPFNTQKNKYINLIKNTQENSINLDFLKKQSLSVSNSLTFKRNRYVEIDFTPFHYDLYNFKGITYQTGQNSPEPAQAYDAEEIRTGWYIFTFKYPTTAFPVPEGEDPADYSSGATDWESFEGHKICKVNHIHTFKNISKDFFNYTRVVSCLYTESGNPVPEYNIIDPYDPDYERILCTYNNFYRFVTTEIKSKKKSCDFYYYAIFPYSASEEIKLKVRIYLINPKQYKVTQVNGLES